MGDWQKTIDALVEAWEKFTTSIKEMVDAPVSYTHLTLPTN